MEVEIRVLTHDGNEIRICGEICCTWEALDLGYDEIIEKITITPYTQEKYTSTDRDLIMI